MPPSDEDIKDLWKGIDELKEMRSKDAQTLARIEAMLSERCVNRGKNLDDMGTRIKDTDARIKDTDARIKEIEKKLWWMGGAAAAVATILGWVLKLGGNHG